MAVFFWITIWQFASMYLGQEILLASPVSVVRKLFELIFSGNFWQSVGFSFVRIVTGFLLAVLLGIFLAVWAYWSKTVEILTAPVIAVVKSTPVASFIILCLIWIPSKNLSVFISFLMVLPVIYTNILGIFGDADERSCLDVVISAICHEIFDGLPCFRTSLYLIENDDGISDYEVHIVYRLQL